MWQNKKITGVLALLIICTFYVAAQKAYNDISSNAKETIFTESFDNNSNNWFLDNLWIKGNITGGFYNVICKNYQKNSGLSYNPIAIDQTKDYEIETSLKTLKGTGGLIFGVNSKFDHYRIELANNTLLIVKNTPSKGKNEELFSGASTVMSKAGSYNKITIRKVKDTFYVFLNEALVSKLDKIKPDGDQIGFNVGLNSEISVDYLNVSYLVSSTAQVNTQIDISKKDTVSIPSLNTPQSKSVQNASSRADTILITWIAPSVERMNIQGYSAHVRAKVKSESELSSVIFYVNGSPKGESDRKLISGEPGNYQVEKTINFDPGENVVYFTVTNEKKESRKSEERYFTIPEATKPVITWGIPAESNVSVDNERLNIEVCVKSPSELKSIKVLVNGEPMGGDNVFKLTGDENCNIKWQYPIILREGLDNSIVIIAENIAGSSPSESRIVRYSKAIAQKRIALVIGNSNYGTKTPLKNPIQDANLMQATLESLGFTVEKFTDLDLLKMRAAIRDFSQKMKDYNVALFYYAGHGVQVDGKNYLIPIDAKLEGKDACEWETFAVNDLLAQFEKNPKNINIAILDACRSNPFTSWVRGDAAGFVTLSNTSGTFVSFATAPGSTAADGNTGNGLFTEELVKQMNIPQPISSVFMNTRINVFNRSNKTQRPQEWNDLNGEFYFKK
jgi:hypothetical protein